MVERKTFLMGWLAPSDPHLRRAVYSRLAAQPVLPTDQLICSPRWLPKGEIGAGKTLQPRARVRLQIWNTQR